MVEQDPGVQGKKLSKSDDDAKLAARNKSYEKVLDAQIAWIRESKWGCADMAEGYKQRWKKKSAWHEKEFGW